MVQTPDVSTIQIHSLFQNTRRIPLPLPAANTQSSNAAQSPSANYQAA
jgi:hypothetical protein